MLNPDWAKALFQGRRTLVWLGLSLFHFVMADLYDRPVIWNPIYTAHVFNPHAGYLTVDESNVNNLWELA